MPTPTPDHTTMRLTPETAPWLFTEATQAVLAALARDGHSVRIVGGAVRNALLGRRVADIDMATDAQPAATLDAAERAALKTIPTGLAHGTVTVVSGSVPYEVTTLRRDVETDGRHAVVAFTDDWRADASRRDFTINALYADRDGTIFDPLGSGVTDLMARRVRFIGDADARIGEDYLRILRFFRFSAEYAAGPLDQPGLLAIARHVDGLDRVSIERVWGELKKILVAPRALEAVQAMIDHGVFVRIVGAVPQPSVFARRIAIETRRATPADAIERLAALLMITSDDVARLAQRLRMSGDERDRLRAVLATPAIAKTLSSQDARACHYHHRDAYSQRLLHDWALSGDAIDDAAWQALANGPETEPAPRFPISGTDIILAGVPQGARIGALLQALEAWWVENGFPNRPALDAELARLLKQDHP